MSVHQIGILKVSRGEDPFIHGLLASFLPVELIDWDQERNGKRGTKLLMISDKQGSSRLPGVSQAHLPCCSSFCWSSFSRQCVSKKPKIHADSVLISPSIE